jgi:uncharacterized protein YktB (UPF0637 family)
MTTTNTTAVLPVAKLSEAGFVPNDFATFAIDGLEQRMAAIQSRIQPKFRALGERLTHELMPAAVDELFLHIAKHARRTVNAPKDTWMALCSNKRGYKQHPHFQLGLFDDHLFLWLAFIYELPNKSEIASALLGELDTVIHTVPDDYVVSFDHMKKDSTPAAGMTESDWRAALTRFRDVKSAELLIGRHLSPGEAIVQSGEKLLQTVIETYETLMPLYRVAMR